MMREPVRVDELEGLARKHGFQWVIYSEDRRDLAETRRRRKFANWQRRLWLAIAVEVGHLIGQWLF